MNKYTNKLFNLQGLLMGKIDFDDENNEIIVHVRNPRLYVKCPNCGKSTKRIHQKYSRLVKHGTSDGRIVILELIIRRFKCHHCKKGVQGKYLRNRQKAHNSKFQTAIIGLAAKKQF